MKESKTATTLRIIFTILLVPLTGVVSIAVFLAATLFSSAYWRSVIFTDDIRESLADDIWDDSDRFYLDQLDLSSKEEDKMKNELIDIIADEMFDALKNEDYEVDRDRLDDFFDEYNYIDVLKDQGYSSREIERQKDDMYEEIDDKLEEAFTDPEAYEVLHMISQSYHNWIKITIALAVVILALMAVIIATHRNKLLPVRSLGIAITISEGTNLSAASAFLGIITAAMNEAAEDEMEEFIAQAFTRFTGHMLLAFFILLVIGIIITVVSSRLINAMKRVESDEVYTEPGLE